MIIKSEQCHYDVSPCPEGYQWHNNGGRIHYSCAKYAEDGETFLNNVICSGYACLGQLVSNILGFIPKACYLFKRIIYIKYKQNIPLKTYKCTCGNLPNAALGDDYVFYNTDCQKMNCLATEYHEYEDYCLPLLISPIQIQNPPEIETGSCGSNGNEPGDYNGWTDAQSQG